MVFWFQLIIKTTKEIPVSQFKLEMTHTFVRLSSVLALFSPGLMCAEELSSPGPCRCPAMTPQGQPSAAGPGPSGPPHSPTGQAEEGTEGVE